MSIIAGIYQLDREPIDCALLKRMIGCRASQSRAETRIQTNGFVGLGYRHFCTSGSSVGEVEPAGGDLGHYWLAFDGRIDNREELLLKWDLDRVAEPTDGQLLLSLYKRWGPQCLKWVIGDYAFALWDGRQRHLYCGRDTYGIRPFYYHFDGKRFVFGSDCYQLLQDPTISLRIDQAKMAEWFTWCGVLNHTYGNAGNTFFRDISALPPAHYLIVNHSGIKLKRYWDADPQKDIRYRRTQDYTEHFLSLFREAVRCRLRGPAPVGAELSGGFDSSSIVCVAADLLRSEGSENRRLATFSLVFDQLACDERPLINAVVGKYRLESHQLAADSLCGPLGLSESDPSRCNINSPDQLHLLRALQALYQLAYDRGVRVMLSGEGAEQQVMGNSLVLDSLFRHFRWRELLRRVSVMMAESSSYRSVLSSTLKFGIWPVLSGKGSTRYYYPWLHPDLYAGPGLPILTAQFAREVSDQLVEQRERLFGFTRFKEWGKQLVYEGLTPGAGVFCNDISPNLPIERRFPFHDRRLIEYCLAIPPEEKFQHLRYCQKRNVRGRALQRNALEGVLPDEILRSQAKVNFNEISRKRMLELRGTYTDLFCPPAVPQVSRIEVVEANGFWQSISDFFAGLDKGAPFDASSYLWINRVAQLEIWLKALKEIEEERSNRQADCSTDDFLRPIGGAQSHYFHW